jgi:FtsH-binding integral membrane protein
VWKVSAAATVLQIAIGVLVILTMVWLIGMTWSEAAVLGFVMALSFGINRMSTSTVRTLFWAFAVAMGLSLSSIFFVYTGPSIASTCCC